MTGGSVRFPPVVFLYDGATGRSSFLLLVFFLVPPRRGPSRDPIVILSACGWSESKKDVVRALNLNSYA